MLSRGVRVSRRARRSHRSRVTGIESEGKARRSIRIGTRAAAWEATGKLRFPHTLQHPLGSRTRNFPREKSNFHAEKGQCPRASARPCPARSTGYGGDAGADAFIGDRRTAFGPLARPRRPPPRPGPAVKPPGAHNCLVTTCSHPLRLLASVVSAEEARPPRSVTRVSTPRFVPRFVQLTSGISHPRPSSSADGPRAMTVAVADERRAIPPPAPGKIRQPAETTPADRRAPSPSDSGSDTTEAGDAANPIQRTPDAVAMAKDGASAPAPARPASTPPQVGNAAANNDIGGLASMAARQSPSLGGRTTTRPRRRYTPSPRVGSRPR